MLRHSIANYAVRASLPLLAALAWWPLRLAWAEHLSRTGAPETVARAVRLAPGDADLRLRLAGAQQAAGIDPRPALEAAAALEPANAEAWMKLGLAAELHGDLREAERCLLTAARVSRQFAPRWALANYYFRRHDEDRFWPWVRHALEMGSGDLSPVFRLCWSLRPDAGQIYARAIPERPAVLDSYVGYLLREGRSAACKPVAMKLAALGGRDDLSTLMVWCNRQIDAGEVSPTLEVWNTLCKRHLIPYAPLDPDRSPLTDGGFAEQPYGWGFAWRTAQPRGITIGRNPSPPYLWIAFSGDQPEWISPLAQFVPVTAGGAYAFRFEFRTAEIPVVSGLRWKVYDAGSSRELAGSDWLSSADWKAAEVSFTAPASGLVGLSLTCQRMAGATRIDGSLALRGVSVGRHP